MRSLTFKMDRLAAVRNDTFESFGSSVLCVSPGRSCRSISHTHGFSDDTADKDLKKSGKTKGGGRVELVNNKWCDLGLAAVKHCFCSSDIELFAVIIYLLSTKSSPVLLL